MPETNPRDMLKLYRLNADAFTADQAFQVRDMPTGEAIELLAFMTLNLGRLLQMLNEKIDGQGAAPVEPMPTPPTAN